MSASAAFPLFFVERVQAGGGFIILGIDSGATVAYAIVDYEGRVAKVKSRKNWPLAELVGELLFYYPAVVACDTNPPSKLARTIQRAFSARLWRPKYSLTHHHEKAKLAREIKHRNNHERDAIAAALKAYQSLAGKLRQVKRRASARRLETEAALRAVLAGRKLSEVLERGP